MGISNGMLIGLYHRSRHEWLEFQQMIFLKYFILPVFPENSVYHVMQIVS